MSVAVGNIRLKMKEFSATSSSLAEMMKYIRTQGKKNHLSEKMLHKVELACEEALVNIIQHAYPDPDSERKGKLMIECAKKGCRFEVHLEDEGVPFNPIDFDINPQVDIPMPERKVGGLGIFLIRKAIDEASYIREEEKNVLKLTFFCERSE